MHLRYIKQINAAVKDKPAGMAITTHMCRGNFRSSWAASGGYDFVAEALFSELDVDGFFLEYDDERSGGFEPLRFVPKGKMVVLGLVTTKRPELESKDELKRRVDEAAKYVPLDQLCLSGQCGFSSTVEGNALTYDQQVAKLRLIVETAHRSGATERAVPRLQPGRKSEPDPLGLSRWRGCAPLCGCTLTGSAGMPPSTKEGRYRTAPGSTTSSRSTRSARSRSTAAASMRARTLPRQLWMPWPKLTCLRRLGRSGLKSSGESKTVRSRFAEMKDRKTMAPSGSGTPPSVVARVTRRNIPCTGLARRRPSSTRAAARRGSSRSSRHRSGASLNRSTMSVISLVVVSLPATMSSRTNQTRSLLVRAP